MSCASIKETVVSRRLRRLGQTRAQCEAFWVLSGDYSCFEAHRLLKKGGFFVSCYQINVWLKAMHGALP